MTRARFRGFRVGDQVELTVSQGGESRQASVPAWKTPGAVSVTISVTRSASGVAPEGVWLEASTSGFSVPSPGVGEVYDARLHRLHYAWDFGPGVSGGYDSVQHFPAAWNTKRTGFGPALGKVFPAGTHDVTCTVIDPATGQSAQASVQIEVLAPEAVYAPVNEYAVSTDGDFSGLPVGVPVGNRFTDFDTAITAYRGDNSRGRLLLKRGQTFPSMNGFSNAGGHIAAFGFGANPIIEPQYGTSGTDESFCSTRGSREATNKEESRFESIDFVGEWNPVLEQTTNHAVFHMLSFDGGYHSVVQGCGFKGVRTGMVVGSYFESGNYFIEDCVIEDWQNYGLYVSNGDGTLSVRGTKISQNPEAWMGGPKPINHNNHGPIRMGGLAKAAIAKSSFFSRNGWTNDSGGYKAYQPCIRVCQNSQRGAYCHISECYCESGYQIIQQQHASQNYSRAGNYIYEKNALQGNVSTWTYFRHGCGGVTIRNNLCAQVDLDNTGNNMDRFVQIVPEIDGADPVLDQENLNAPIEIYGNTFYDPRSTPRTNVTPAVVEVSSHLATMEVNNILHAPNGPTPADAGSFDLSQYLPTVYPGRNGTVKTDPATLDTSSATPAGSMVTMKPLPGNPNIGAATSGLVPYDDIEGRPRGASPSKGAWEPD